MDIADLACSTRPSSLRARSPPACSRRTGTPPGAPSEGQRRARPNVWRDAWRARDRAAVRMPAITPANYPDSSPRELATTRSRATTGSSPAPTARASSSATVANSTRMRRPRSATWAAHPVIPELSRSGTPITKATVQSSSSDGAIRRPRSATIRDAAAATRTAARLQQGLVDPEVLEVSGRVGPGDGWRVMVLAPSITRNAFSV